MKILKKTIIFFFFFNNLLILYQTKSLSTNYLKYLNKPIKIKVSKNKFKNFHKKKILIKLETIERLKNKVSYIVKPTNWIKNLYYIWEFLFKHYENVKIKIYIGFNNEIYSEKIIFYFNLTIVLIIISMFFLPILIKTIMNLRTLNKLYLDPMVNNFDLFKNDMKHSLVFQKLKKDFNLLN